MSAPLCRACGKPIAKQVREVEFGRAAPGHDFQSSKPEIPATVAEARRYVNGIIVSSRRGHQGNLRVGVWDGETYVDPHFHSNGCAERFGRSMAREFPNHAFPAYHDAMAARKDCK